LEKEFGEFFPLPYGGSGKNSPIFIDIGFFAVRSTAKNPIK
jgi:hypothetical protein